MYFWRKISAVEKTPENMSRSESRFICRARRLLNVVTDVQLHLPNPSPDTAVSLVVILFAD